MIEKTVERANHAYATAGAERARRHLVRVMATFSDFYRVCSERAGAPGFAFRLVGVTETTVECPVDRFPGPWLRRLARARAGRDVSIGQRARL